MQGVHGRSCLVREGITSTKVGCDLECSCVTSWAWFDCYLPWGAFAEFLTGLNALLFVHWTLVSRWFILGFAFLRIAVFQLFDLFSWLPVRSLPVGELSCAGLQGLPSLVAAHEGFVFVLCFGSRSWSLRLWSSSSC